jgi:acyl transferase domain-containing protein
MKDAVAIIGMAGRFPGAPSLEQYWRNLVEGKESIRFFTAEELRAAGVDEATLADPRYVRAAPTLEGVELFDSELFSYSKKEADILDPQHRLLLECAWEALEDAGQAPNGGAARIGVFAGSAGAVTSYLLTCLAKEPAIRGATGGLEHLGNDKDFLPTRVSYELNLTGPSVAVQTACSTSLVAVHLACQSLRTGDCELALAGGVSVRIPQAQGYFRRHGDIFSADGHCRAFDARATGIVFGSGVGLVLLKPLDAALRDGDPVRAVILSTAINNDGGKKISYTASSSTGQDACMEAALARAAIDPATLGFVEAHGTGTAMGDPIEVATLTRVFRRRTPAKGFCAIGSVKNNVGHLDTASGVASLIKTVLALEQERIPPVINFETPNPKIDFAASPFYVNTKAADWPAGGSPRRAAVNSLGIGGTNAFAILEEAPRAGARTDASARRPPYAVCLSARGPEALADYARELAEWLRKNSDADLADFAFTVNVSRSFLPWRIGVVGSSAAELAAAFESHAANPELARRREGDDARVAFLFGEDAGERAATQVELWRSWGIVPSAVLGVGAGRALADALARSDRNVEFLEASQGAVSLAELCRLGFRNFLELGPARTLLDSAGPIPSEFSASTLAVASAPPIEALAALASVGARVNWRAVDGRERQHRLRLPTYPFRRRRPWIE